MILNSCLLVLLKAKLVKMSSRLFWYHLQKKDSLAFAVRMLFVDVHKGLSRNITVLELLKQSSRFSFTRTVLISKLNIYSSVFVLEIFRGVDRNETKHVWLMYPLIFIKSCEICINYVESCLVKFSNYSTLWIAWKFLHVYLLADIRILANDLFF